MMRIGHVGIRGGTTMTKIGHAIAESKKMTIGLVNAESTVTMIGRAGAILMTTTGRADAKRKHRKLVTVSSPSASSAW
jgi:hypothetical protein